MLFNRPADFALRLSFAREMRAGRHRSKSLLNNGEHNGTLSMVISLNDGKVLRKTVMLRVICVPYTP